MDIVMQTVDQMDIDRIKPLWEKLIEYHRLHAGRFEPGRHPAYFEDRKRELLKKAQYRPLRIEFALDHGVEVGYCISAVNEEGVGEIESLIIEKAYRANGIGGQLVLRSCLWMDDLKLRRKIVAVSEGNEEVFGFYRRYGFHPLVQTLAQIRPSGVSSHSYRNMEFSYGGFDDLEVIRPLWEKLSCFEGDTTPFFKQHFENRSFSDHQALIARTSPGGFRLELVRPRNSPQVAGYSISTITESRLGKIDSLYVEPGFRRQGIGYQLLSRSLNWLEDRNIGIKFLMTPAGNHRALKFFNRFNFYCRNTILQQV